MPEWFDKAFAFAQDRWDTWYGFLVSAVLAAIALLLLFASIDFSAITLLQWGIVLFVIIALFFLWRRTRLPRARKGRVGFAIGLRLEDSPEAQILRADFIDALENLLANSGFTHPFSFVELPQRVSNRLINVTDAKPIMTRGRFHFLLYGRARLRSMPDGTAGYVIDLSGSVRHRPIHETAAEHFGSEFSSVFPKRLLIDQEGGFLACEFAARHLDAVARYIIGIAAALSGDFYYAEQLLRDSEQRVEALIAEATPSSVPANVLLGKIQGILRELYTAWLAQLTWSYIRSRDSAVLREAEKVMGRFRSDDPTNYTAHLMAAICHFVLRRNLASAWSEINECHGVADAAWRYSEAFLHAYEGELQSAYQSYQRAFRAPLSDPSVPTQSEEFIQIILEEEAEKYWLSYALGLINFKGKQDLQAARSDFEQFLDRAEPSRFERQIDVTRGWLQELEQRLGGNKGSP